MFPFLHGLLGSAALPYDEKVLATLPIAYWPLTELTGTVADNAEGTAARDGTYSGVTLDSVDGPIIGTRAGLWTQAGNSYCNIYSASLAAAFNGAAGTFIIGFKVLNAGIWGDGLTHYLGSLRADASNQVLMDITTAGALRFRYQAGGTLETVLDTTLLGTTGWNQAGITWSKAADEVRAYGNGNQVGTIQNGLGTWAGSLASTVTVLGANTTTPANEFEGYLAQAIVYNRALTPAEMADLFYSSVPSPAVGAYGGTFTYSSSIEP